MLMTNAEEAQLNQVNYLADHIKMHLKLRDKGAGHYQQATHMADVAAKLDCMGEIGARLLVSIDTCYEKNMELLSQRCETLTDWKYELDGLQSDAQDEIEDKENTGCKVIFEQKSQWIDKQIENVEDQITEVNERIDKLVREGIRFN